VPIFKREATAITTTDTALLRLLQLSSAALPVGGYSFSHGLEFAIDEGWLKSTDDIAEWMSVQLFESLACVDVPILQRQLSASISGDVEALTYWNAYILACRESAELRLTDTAMGAALIKLLVSLNVTMPFQTKGDISYVTAFAMAAAHWQLDSDTCCQGYLWSWLENQIAAATKIMPLGQTMAQQLLGDLLQVIPAVIVKSSTLNDDCIGASLPAVAMASARHETQYTRLYRS
jgi:urease accessory protein